MPHLQDNKCAICKKTVEENKRNLAVDHNHITGKIRGLLCNTCNSALGMFKGDLGTDLLEKAINYLNVFNK